MAPEKKLVVIVGVTGNQGGSVASARALASKGIEIIAADLDDVATLIPAFRGANLIFSVTNYWEPFFRSDCRAKAAELGVSCRKYAYEVEVRQGRNIAEAVAATVDSLDENGFIASTLSHATRCGFFPGYVEENHSMLARKTSYVQTGFFMSSYRLAPGAYFRKTDEGSFLMSFPCSRDALVPHLVVNTDLGPFIYAVSKLPPGKHYLAAGTICSWSEYMRIWSKITGNQTSYKEITLQELIENTPDKLGVECPMTSLEQRMRKEDWSMVLNQ
ncbi:hypothetical protein H2199_003494 [Coniosporium tulheliwenetii]|uniref:Uncharacterized protein n=1 Tax=Coniosporium tulheliwenetii TaxID=3383036 RepID=A0ACC2Z9U9_9PEZI|nr:hypothetical protein H2199_003494 [Cladosporium sp. JES 115]